MLSKLTLQTFEKYEHFKAINEAIAELWPSSPEDTTNWVDIKDFIRQRDSLLNEINWITIKSMEDEYEAYIKGLNPR